MFSSCLARISISRNRTVSVPTVGGTTECSSSGVRRGGVDMMGPRAGASGVARRDSGAHTFLGVDHMEEVERGESGADVDGGSADAEKHVNAAPEHEDATLAITAFRNEGCVQITRGANVLACARAGRVQVTLQTVPKGSVAVAPTSRAGTNSNSSRNSVTIIIFQNWILFSFGLYFFKNVFK
jgi:hypothetical protein